jgi:hypothetical protein
MTNHDLYRQPDGYRRLNAELARGSRPRAGPAPGLGQARRVNGSTAGRAVEAATDAGPVVHRPAHRFVPQASALEALYRTEPRIHWEGIAIGVFLAASMALCSLQLAEVTTFGALFVHQTA